MAYIGQNLDRFSNVEKLDVITPATATGAGPYNLTQNSTAFTPINANSLVISIDGVIQYGNFSVNNATVTFDAALSDANTCDFIYQMGIGLISTPADDTVTTAKLSDNSVTSAKIVNDTIVNADINSSAAIATTKLASNSITINGSAVALGGSVTVGETKPTATGCTPSTITNDATNVVIAGTNFVSIPQVWALNTATGIWYLANSVSYTSATSITANFTLSVDAQYKIRVENPDGNATLSGSNLLTVSDEPTWSTASGSLGTFAGNFSGTLATLSASSDSTIAYSETTSVLAGAGVTLNTSTGALTTSDFGASSTTPTTYNFTIRATDGESQTTDRTFSMTSTYGATGGGQFN